MDRAAYDDFSSSLVESLTADPRVIGLVALGSMAAVDRQPDEWSDHDFWLVTRDGDAAAVRSDVSWLPRYDEIAVWFAETAHGRSAIYGDGHLAEYAVFDDGELEIAGANVYRVLIDRCDLEHRMRSMVQRTTGVAAAADPTGEDRFGAFLTQITIGVTRFARGERLSANDMIRGRAARTLVGLLGSFLDTDRADSLDNLDPTRRFEQAHPGLAEEIDAALHGPLLRCAAVLVRVAARELVAIPSADAAAISAVRATLARAEATTSVT